MSCNRVAIKEAVPTCKTRQCCLALPHALRPISADPIAEKCRCSAKMRLRRVKYCK